MRAAAVALTGILSFWGGWAARACDPAPLTAVTVPLTGVTVLFIVVIVFAHAAHEKD